MSQKLILLVNGEDHWQACLPQYHVYQVRVQTADFLLKDGRLLVIDGCEEVDGTRYVLEYNDIPGISGFPTECKQALADLIRRLVNRARTVTLVT